MQSAASARIRRLIVRIQILTSGAARAGGVASAVGTPMKAADKMHLNVRHLRRREKKTVGADAVADEMQKMKTNEG
ncbi:hypothetical protein EVAR_65903_1 [Eumeta japonica]|uniref:Uncharacterized protein n=1 Tax=Eumeta variegata TaxID=151549 RepID=A0A4C1ZXQ8_EUMVA|nr:hypothetical protein EVAR_65903_1 [Eumeta japonica]